MVGVRGSGAVEVRARPERKRAEEDGRGMAWATGQGGERCGTGQDGEEARLAQDRERGRAGRGAGRRRRGTPSSWDTPRDGKALGETLCPQSRAATASTTAVMRNAMMGWLSKTAQGSTADYRSLAATANTIPASDPLPPSRHTHRTTKTKAVNSAGEMHSKRQGCWSKHRIHIPLWKPVQQDLHGAAC